MKLHTDYDEMEIKLLKDIIVCAVIIFVLGVISLGAAMMLLSQLVR